MSTLLDRIVASTDQRLVVLAPPQAEIPRSFRNVPSDASMHADLLREVQRLRGAVYLEDGAVTRDELSPAGLHQTREDSRAWHLMILGRAGVTACVWYLQHDDAHSVEELRVRECPLNDAEDWRQTFRRAVEDELARAQCEGLNYVELGGWAVAPASRHTGEGLLLALAAFSLGRALGGALGLTTATVRHASSTILRRLGGTSLEAGDVAVPTYYDPRYRCDMELLRFDSRSPSSKYLRVIELLEARFESVPVVASTGHAAGVEVLTNIRVPSWQLVRATGGAAA